METTFKQLEENQIELTVTVPAAEVELAVKEAYAKANENRIKGFRKGKAPRNVLDKVFGGAEYFLAEATDEVVKASYLLAIDGEGFTPLDTPDMSTIDPAVEGEDYSYTFTFTVAPELTLSSYDPVHIELPPEEPTAAEIQSRVDTMLSYYAEYQEITDRVSQAGDTLTLQITVSQNGEQVDNMSGDDVPFDVGVDQMPDEFESHFLGIELGTEVSFDFQMPYYDGAEEGEDQELHVEATLKAISLRAVPELTDEWVSEKLEYDSAEQFRQLIADSLRDQNQAAMPSLKERRVAEAIAERLEGDPPEMLISEMAQDIYSDIFMSLQSQGITLDAYLASVNQDPDSFRESVQSQAVNNARQVMALDAWARHFDYEATEEDIRTEFEKADETADVDEAISQWTQNGRMTEIRNGILRMKAAQKLNEEAIVTEQVLLSLDEIADAASDEVALEMSDEVADEAPDPAAESSEA